MFSIIFGITLEFLQYLLPFGRYFDFYDILANMAGVIIGIIILLFYKKYIEFGSIPGELLTFWVIRMSEGAGFEIFQIPNAFHVKSWIVRVKTVGGIN